MSPPKRLREAGEQIWGMRARDAGFVLIVLGAAVMAGLGVSEITTPAQCPYPPPRYVNGSPAPYHCLTKQTMELASPFYLGIAISVSGGVLAASAAKSGKPRFEGPPKARQD